MTVAQRLRRRAELLRRLRRFFDDRGFLEAHTPLLVPEVIPEEHIEPFPVPKHPHPLPLPHPGGGENRIEWDRGGVGGGGEGSPETAPSHWLQSSPEAHMKRLLVDLAAERADQPEPIAIYQITRSFRAGEFGPLHRPEFTIVEWYRTEDDMAAGMHLLDELCRNVVDALPAERISYQEAFERFVDVDPHAATSQQLRDVLRARGIEFAADASEAEPRDNVCSGGAWERVGEDRARVDLLNLLLVKHVEPNLGRDSPEILYDYPASQASLAAVRTRKDGVQVAERFELYWRGVELANGFHELTDAAELRQRFECVNAVRTADRRPALPMPEQFLAAMERGLPPCTGVALGFDRLLMVAAGESELPPSP